MSPPLGESDDLCLDHPKVSCEDSEATGGQLGIPNADDGAVILVAASNQRKENHRKMVVVVRFTTIIGKP